MSSENSPKPICAQECKLYCLEGVEKIKTEKKKNDKIFHQCGKKIATNTVMASIVRLFNSHFSLFNLSQLKFILALQILRFSPQNAPHCATK